MDKVIRIAGVAAPLLVDNIDTDALAPTRLLNGVDVDFGKALLGNWRYDDATERADFVLNQPPFRQASILVAGANFGCGSSREHAVWALMGFGFRCVLAASFGDIFYENACKNGLLPIVLPRETLDRIGAEILGGRQKMSVDLDSQQLVTPAGETLSFRIDPWRRSALLEGLDEIGQTLKDTDRIDRFQAGDRANRPWIYRTSFQAGDR